MTYLEDMVVGTVARFGDYEVTREAVIEFATKFDPQPFHLSDEAAAETYFGRVAASGWHSCAMAMAMIVENMQKRDHAFMGSPGIDELRWLKPVYPGDTLSLETELIEVTPSRSRLDIGSARTRTTMFNQHGDTVMRFVSITLVKRRPDQAA